MTAPIERPDEPHEYRVLWGPSRSELTHAKASMQKPGVIKVHVYLRSVYAGGVTVHITILVSYRRREMTGRRGAA